mmetsp:Transcript_7822/g.11242  ORF Transcript_7822/g.11242 Transcript_7822/m.11242 type:complete len:343 (-) Transcript_7822:2014-3042(-)
MPRRSFIGLLANVFAILGGIRMDHYNVSSDKGDHDGTKDNHNTPKKKIHNESGYAQLMQMGSILAKIIDIADLAIDCAFVVELASTEGGEYRYWSIWMGCTIVIGFVLSRICYQPIVNQSIEQYGYGSWNYAYYFGTSGLIIFWIEDTTTIFLYADKPGAFDETHVADILNILSTLASATLVSIFILTGGMKLVFSSSPTTTTMVGNDASSSYWIPDLTITRFVREKCTCWNTQRIIKLLIFVKCCWVVVSMGFFGYLVFEYVLQDKVIEGSLALTTRIIYGISICMGILLCLRLPTRTPSGKKNVEEQDGILKQSIVEEGQALALQEQNTDDSTSSAKQVV